MPKLTDSSIKNASITGKAYRLYDESGMYLQISATGNKYFRLKFYLLGKEQSPFALGVYPATSLKEARMERDEARKLISDGVNPHETKKQSLSNNDESNTFEFIAKEWMSRQNDVSDSTKSKNVRLLKFAIDSFGSKPINKITPVMVLEVCRKEEEKGYLT
jgi:hypothetical protein